MIVHPRIRRAFARCARSPVAVFRSPCLVNAEQSGAEVADRSAPWYLYIRVEREGVGGSMRAVDSLRRCGLAASAGHPPTRCTDCEVGA